MKSAIYPCKPYYAALKKTTMHMALFTAVFLIAVFLMPWGGRTVFAADENIALTVTKDGTKIKEFTIEDLKDIALSEGNGEYKSYKYSAWNVYPSFSTTDEDEDENLVSNWPVHGPTVDRILTEAGLRSDISDNTVISFNGNGYIKKLTGKQLFKEKRYYFPNGSLVDLEKGMVPEADAYTGAEEVPAVISTDSVHNYKFYIGQAAPNEENNPLFVKNMAAGGIIDVSTQTAERVQAITVDPPGGTLVTAGQEIAVTSNVSDYDKIYFTLDGSKPDYGSAIYNYGPKSDSECRPSIGTTGEKVILKVVVKGYGKQDSIVQTFTYYTDALGVKVNGEYVKIYASPDDLKTLPMAGPLDYSGYNSFPTFDIKHVDSAVCVKDIIKDATGKDVSEYDERYIIKFSGGDGYTSMFTFGQLFGKGRYYFPNAQKGTDLAGGKAETAAYEGKGSVPAVIDLEGKNTLMFGQAAPNDQNYPECVSDMLYNGVIEIITEEAEKCSPVTVTTPTAGSVIDTGTQIELPELSKNDKRNKVYYIVDPAVGQEPGDGCDFYHYSPYNWPEKLFNKPVISGEGKHTLAVKVSAYGKQDSDVTYFEYTAKQPEPVPDKTDGGSNSVTPSEPAAPSDSEQSAASDKITAPAVPAGLKASALSYKSIKLTWKKQSGITGYRLYRATGSGSFKLHKTFKAGTSAFTDNGLKTGTKYSYRLTAYNENTSGKVAESSRTAKVSAKPFLKKPSVKLTSGKRKITLKWGKIAGANGYVIYRSTKKSSGYKKIKTVTKGKTIRFVSKNLKKGKRYYYRIRAYRKVNGKKVYSKYSAVKSAKAR